MKITIWDVFSYINKWKVGIVEIVMLSLLATALYVNNHQTYNAETIIKYTDQNVRSGYTPTGEKLDVYEIISPNIISRAIEDLNINNSVENIRSRVIITPIIPDEVLEIKKAKAKEAEEYHYFPVSYSVRFVAGSDKNGGYARDIVEAIIKNYSIYYAETYLNNAIIPEIDYDTDIKTHDYLEIAEVMDSAVSSTIQYLEECYSSDMDFRSPVTGMSLNDLTTDYKAIKNFDIPALFSNIRNAQITKDREALLKKYKYRKEQYLLTSEYQTQSSDVAFTLMEGFVESNKSVPNSYNRDTDSSFNTNNIIIHDAKRAKTTYDDLVDNYVSDGIRAENSLTEADYCEIVLESFSKPADINMDYDTARASADNKINYIRDKLTRLYRTTSATIRDYNSLNASRHIESLSGIVITTSLSLKFYLLVAFVIGLMLGVFASIAFEVIIRLRREGLHEHSG